MDQGPICVNNLEIVYGQGCPERQDRARTTFFTRNDVPQSGGARARVSGRRRTVWHRPSPAGVSICTAPGRVRAQTTVAGYPLSGAERSRPSRQGEKAMSRESAYLVSALLLAT